MGIDIMGLDIMGSMNPTVEGICKGMEMQNAHNFQPCYSHACVFPDIKLRIKYSILYIYVVVWWVDMH